jgi:hypothetical protein
VVLRTALFSTTRTLAGSILGLERRLRFVITAKQVKLSGKFSKSGETSSKTYFLAGEKIFNHLSPFS